MKINVLFGVLILLVIVNIVAVDTYLYFHFMRSPDVPADSGEKDRNPLATLSEEQRTELNGVLEDFRASVGEIHGTIRTLDDDIFSLLRQDSIQRGRIEGNLKQISELRLKISSTAIEKMIEAKAFLSPEQQDQLFRMIFRTGSPVRRPQQRREQEPLSPASEPTGTQPPMPSAGGPESGRFLKYSRELNLSNKQEAELRIILQESERRRAALGIAATGNPEQMRRQTKEIMDSEDARVRSILTEDQKTLFSAMKKKPRPHDPPPPEE